MEFKKVNRNQILNFQIRFSNQNRNFKLEFCTGFVSIGLEAYTPIEWCKTNVTIACIEHIARQSTTKKFSLLKISKEDDNFIDLSFTKSIEIDLFTNLSQDHCCSFFTQAAWRCGWRRWPNGARWPCNRSWWPSPSGHQDLYGRTLVLVPRVDRCINDDGAIFLLIFLRHFKESDRPSDEDDLGGRTMLDPQPLQGRLHLLVKNVSHLAPLQCACMLPVQFSLQISNVSFDFQGHFWLLVLGSEFNFLRAFWKANLKKGDGIEGWGSGWASSHSSNDIISQSRSVAHLT